MGGKKEKDSVPFIIRFVWKYFWLDMGDTTVTCGTIRLNLHENFWNYKTYLRLIFFKICLPSESTYVVKKKKSF